MKVLVTGGAGFIGSRFVRRLVARGDDVVVLDKLTYAGNPANLDGVDVHLAIGDISDAETVARWGAGCEAVVNFAAETHVDRSILGAKEFVLTNVLGTQTLLEFARKTGARLVQVSRMRSTGISRKVADRARRILSTPRALTPRLRRQEPCSLL